MATGYLTPWRRGSLTSGGSYGSGSLLDLHRQMDRLFDDLFTAPATSGLGGPFAGGTGWPQLEIEQKDDRIEVVAELPGVSEDDIELTVEDGVLSLTGEKRCERQDEGGYSERSYGRFERRIALPANIDEDACAADFRDGVLTITIPRSEAKSRGRRIPLGQGGRPGRPIEAQNDAETAPRQQAAEEANSENRRDDQQG